MNPLNKIMFGFFSIALAAIIGIAIYMIVMILTH